MVLVTTFYIYEGLEPTEGGTNTITPFRDRFRPIGKKKFPGNLDFWMRFSILSRGARKVSYGAKDI